MPGCVLRVTGRDLDPAALDLGSLVPYTRFRRGDRRSPANDRVHESGGLKCVVSDHRGSDLPGQLDDAITFLRRHHDALAALVARPDVQEATLDFGYHCRLGQQGTVVQVDRLPPELLRLAGTLGIAVMLSLYPAPADDVDPKSSPR